MTRSTNRILGVIAAAACCGGLAGLGGLGRLVWDQLQGVASPAWLPEWSIKGLAAGVVVGTAVQGWRKHPLLALKTIGAATAIYLGFQAVLPRVLATHSNSSLNVSRVVLAAVGVWACYVLQSILASVAEVGPPLPVRPGPFGINLTEEERRGRRSSETHGTATAAVVASPTKEARPPLQHQVRLSQCLILLGLPARCSVPGSSASARGTDPAPRGDDQR